MIRFFVIISFESFKTSNNYFEEISIILQSLFKNILKLHFTFEYLESKRINYRNLGHESVLFLVTL